MLDELYPARRLADAAAAAAGAGLDALLLTPGPDLRYVIGYDANALERLTCLAVPAASDPFLVVPRLELPAAQASPAGRLGLEMMAWEETDNPYALEQGAEPAPLAQVTRRGRGPAGGRPGDRPSARQRARLAANRPHRAAGRR